MTKFKKAVLGAAAALALAAPVANAALINVGGVIWDPANIFDFNATSGSIVQVPGNPLSGWGRIDFINFDPAATFCPGCELTFQFGGFVQQPAFPNAVGAFEYSAGFVNVYVDNTPDINVSTGAGSGDGVLWLSLSGHSIFGSSAQVFNPTTTLLGTIGGTGATGIGLLDVTGGLAAGNFDTNTLFTGGDVEFQNSFTAGSGFRIGSGNFFSDTIPEPGSLALLGLGLLGLGAARRRKA